VSSPGRDFARCSRCDSRLGLRSLARPSYGCYCTQPVLKSEPKFELDEGPDYPDGEDGEEGE